MKYKVIGDVSKPLMIFITGAGIGPYMWKYQLDHFERYKKIVFNLPGHGDNSDETFTTIKALCNNIKEIINNESDSGKAVLVGHSIGAQTVMYMIQYYRNYVEKAIVISGLNKPMKGVSWLIKPMIILSMPLIKLRSFAKLQSKELSLPADMFDEYYKDSLLISSHTLVNILKDNMSFNFELNGSKNYPDTIVIVGDKEKSMMNKSAIKTSENIGNNSYYKINGAAHGIPYEKPDELNVLMEYFMSNNLKSLNQNGVELCQL